MHDVLVHRISLLSLHAGAAGAASRCSYRGDSQAEVGDRGPRSRSDRLLAGDSTAARMRISSAASRSAAKGRSRVSWGRPVVSVRVCRRHRVQPGEALHVRVALDQDAVVAAITRGGRIGGYF